MRVAGHVSLDRARGTKPCVDCPDEFAAVPHTGELLHPGDTEKLMEYWAHGKGAAKIKWGVPHDFDRCVMHLRKFFPKNPEGLCNHLHVRALGVPPGGEDPGRHHHG